MAVKNFGYLFSGPKEEQACDQCIVPAADLALFDSSASADNIQRGIQAAQEAKPWSAELNSLEGPYKGQGMKINWSF